MVEGDHGAVRLPLLHRKADGVLALEASLIMMTSAAASRSVWRLTSGKGF